MPQIAKCNYDVVSEPEAEEPNETFSDEEKQKLYDLFNKKSNVKDDKEHLIENPFTCRSAFNVRMGLGRDPRHNKGNTDFLDLYETEEGCVHLVNHLDNKMNFTFGKNIANKHKEISLINKYD